MNPPDRLNRSLLSLLAVVLVALGAAGLCAALGAFGTATKDHAVFDNAAGRYVGQHGSWLWPVLAAVGVVVGLLALRWLAAQAGSERASSLPLAAPPRTGTTVLRAGALTDALAAQIEGYRGVAGASAALRGGPGQERLEVAVTVADRVDFTALRRRIESGALADARTALESPEFPVHVAYDVTTKLPSR